MAYVLTIAGVTKTMQQGWSLEETSNGLNLFRFRVKSTDGTYRPALDAEVILTESGTRIFGGTITRLAEAGLAPPKATSIVTTVEAHDFNALTDRRYVPSLGILAGATLKQAMTGLVAYITGVTVDPSQVDGPTMPDLYYTDVLVRDVLNDFTVQSGGHLWEVDYNKLLKMWAPGTRAAPFSVTEAGRQAVGDVIVAPIREGYANRVQVRSGILFQGAQDASWNTNPYEAIYQAPDGTSQAALDAMAPMLLARSLVTRKEVRYHTLGLGLHPGQTQTVTFASRNINNTFLITDVRIRDLGAKNQELDHDVVALEGSVYQTGWQEKWRQMGGRTTTGISVGGGGGGTSSGASVYWLGGSAIEAVQTTSGAWVPASSIEVTLDTVALGRSTGTVNVQLRADSGTVTARFRNVSDGTTAGTSSAVTGAAFQPAIQVPVALTAGSKRYRLELSPSVSSVDIAGMGYVQL